MKRYCHICLEYSRAAPNEIPRAWDDNHDRPITPSAWRRYRYCDRECKLVGLHFARGRNIEKEPTPTITCQCRVCEQFSEAKPDRDPDAYTCGRICSDFYYTNQRFSDEEIRLLYRQSRREHKTWAGFCGVAI